MVRIAAAGADIEHTAHEDDPLDDEDFDVDAIAEQAVLAATQASSTAFSELGLDVGLSTDALYLSSSDPAASSESRFNTVIVPGRWTASLTDFADGCAPEPPPSAASAREVRGGKVRPVDDAILKRKERKAQREAKLDQWYGLPKHRMTPEIEKELLAIKNRAHADPKRFYKGHDSKELPKYFTFATEVGGGLAAAGARATVREPDAHSGRSLLQELLTDRATYDFGEKKRAEVYDRSYASLHSGHGKPKYLTKGKRSTKRGGAWKKTKKS